MDPRRAAAIARLAEEARSAGKAIRAYHGSPHSFSRFDGSRIGTGEGAQSYGHGLYFAGNEGVADHYRKTLSLDAKRTPEVYADDLWRSASILIGPEGGAQSAIRDILYYLGGNPGPEEKAYLEAALRHIRSRDIASGPPPKPRLGHMYEVELGVPEESLLDWDAPLSAQPQNFLKVLRDYDAVPELPSSVPWEPAGDQAYRRLVDRISMSGPARKGQMSPGRAAVAAADAMLAGGVPGVRFLDAGSRGAGAGTRNYVMFPGTEDHIRILRKYGLLAPMALPALQGSD